MIRARYFSRLPQDDVSEMSTHHVLIDEPDCCYTSAFQFFAEDYTSMQDARHGWVALTDQQRHRYYQQESMDRARATYAKS